MSRQWSIVIIACLAMPACDGSAGPRPIVGELASDRIELTAEVDEPIVEIAVAEGQAVTTGQLLLRQDNARARARLEEAEAALAERQARLDELVRGPRQEQIAAARANFEGAIEELAFRKSEFERVTEVHARGLASPELLDRAKAALDAATADHKRRKAELEERLAGTTAEELAQAEQAVRQMAARRDAARVDLARHDLVSPVDGITDTRLYELGERPSPGQPVMVVLGGSQPYARVFVPEELRVRVTTGTAAQVYVDGLENPITGRVRWVSSDASFTPYYALTEHDRGRISFVAKVDLVTDRARLPDGIPVEVELELSEAQ